MKKHNLEHVLFVILVLVILTQIIGLFSRVMMYGLYLTWFTIFIIFTIRLRSVGKFVIVFALLTVLIRIISIALPLSEDDLLIRITVVYLIIFVILLTYLRHPEVQAWEVLSTANDWHYLPIAVVGGFIFGVVVYSLAPSLSVITPTFTSAGVSIILIGFSSFVHALLFRGLVQNSTEKVSGPYKAVIYVAVLMGAMEIGIFPMIAVTIIILESLLAGLVYFKTRNLYIIFIWSFISNAYIYVIGGMFA